jgi:lipopolysaccharide heptosyltransferase II
MDRDHSGENLSSSDHTVDAAYDSRPGFEGRLAERLKGGAKRRAQRLLYLAMAIIGFATRERHVDRPRLVAGNPEIRRILVVRVDLLGDVVLSLPAVRALHRAYPHATIDMLVLPTTASILAAEREDVTRVLPFDPHAWRNPVAILRPKTWRAARVLLRTFREARYDLAVCISGDMGSILTRLSNARRRIGYADESYPFFMTDVVSGGRYQTHQHEVRYVLALARKAGVSVEPGDEQLKLAVSPKAAEQMETVLRHARASTGAAGPLITIHAGARNGQAKRWPLAHIAALADRLVDDLDALVVLTGAPGEAQLAAGVLKLARRRVTSLTGKTSIPELAALIAASDVVVSGDSGPMHIACAVRTPVVALHGPTDPGISGPTAPDAIVLHRRLWCAPCYDASATAECRFGNPVCMKDLAPSFVFSAVRRQLARNSIQPVSPKAKAAHAGPSASS